MKIGTAEWVQGEAQNLEAAAADALFWLRWMQEHNRLKLATAEHEEKFVGMVEALSTKLSEAGVIVAEAVKPTEG